MTYQETINYLYSRLPMFSRVGASAYKKDLHNTLELCKRLGDPQHRFKTIHVAGTNGKGSTSHMLASVLQSAGYRTGLYTSPHLHDFRERIRINGVMVPESFVTQFTEKTAPWYDEIEPSFFEITVAMAFDYFAREHVDIAVIETGLGGRLDSTNIINPELSVITNIGWDHMNILGDTLEKIAFEKAGIIKKNIPVVIGETQPELKHVFLTRAEEENSPIFFADQLRFANEWDYKGNMLVLSVADHHHTDHETYTLDLRGIYQVKNCITALEAIHQLNQQGWNISQDQVKFGLANVRKLTGLHGRWELIGHDPAVILDVGHNEDGIRQILSQLSISDFIHLHIVIGMVKDKEVDRVLQLLPKDASYYFTQSHIPRALEAASLKEKANALGLNGEHYPDVNAALKQARSVAHKNDLILVCGSVFLVGEVIMH
ncbi:MAG TPA: folylpolyglutamate synthase/dihydrofolate synthase family protein [Chitinophagaceae bacterium]|nr:folylpolyglutamate synthase/dihydrofolate synthase family protein [Chitinophagaceae bacterium]